MASTPDSSATGGNGLSEYEVGGVLGHGLAGVLLEATYRPSGIAVVLEEIPPALTDRPGFVEELAAAGEKLSNVAESHLVRGFDVVRDGTALYVVSEAAGGPALATLVGESAPDARESAAICIDVLSALEALHEVGVAHGHVADTVVSVTAKGDARLSSAVVAAALSPKASADGDVSAVATLGRDLLANGGEVPAAVAFALRPTDHGDAGAMRAAITDAAVAAWGDGWRAESALGSKAANAPRTPPVTTMLDAESEGQATVASGEGDDGTALAQGGGQPDDPSGARGAGEPGDLSEAAGVDAKADGQGTAAAVTTTGARRRRRWPLIAILVVLAIGAGAGGGYALIVANTKPPGPLTLVGVITVTAKPSSGGCNATFFFYAEAKVTGEGDLHFRWEQSDGQQTSEKVVHVTSDDASFRLSQPWGVRGSQQLKATMVFHLLQPVDQKALASVTYTCG